MSSAASRDRMIGFRMSSDEIRSRSDDRNQYNMQKKDRNYLLYENRSRMNTKCNQSRDRDIIISIRI